MTRARARKFAEAAEQQAIEAEEAVQRAPELQSTLQRLYLEHDRACDQLSHSDEPFAPNSKAQSLSSKTPFSPNGAKLTATEKWSHGPIIQDFFKPTNGQWRITRE